MKTLAVPFKRGLELTVYCVTSAVFPVSKVKLKPQPTNTEKFQNKSTHDAICPRFRQRYGPGIKSYSVNTGFLQRNCSKEIQWMHLVLKSCRNSVLFYDLDFYFESHSTDLYSLC